LVRRHGARRRVLARDRRPFRLRSLCRAVADCSPPLDVRPGASAGVRQRASWDASPTSSPAPHQPPPGLRCARLCSSQVWAPPPCLVGPAWPSTSRPGATLTRLQKREKIWRRGVGLPEVPDRARPPLRAGRIGPTPTAPATSGQAGSGWPAGRIAACRQTVVLKSGRQGGGIGDAPSTCRLWSPPPRTPPSSGPVSVSRVGRHIRWCNRPVRSPIPLLHFREQLPVDLRCVARYLAGMWNAFKQMTADMRRGRNARSLSTTAALHF